MKRLATIFGIAGLAAEIVWLLASRPSVPHDASAQVATQRPTVKVFILRDTNTYLIGDPCTTANCVHIRSVTTDQPVRSFNVRTNNLAESLRAGTEDLLLVKSRQKFRNIYGFSDAQIDANSYRLHLKLTQAEVDQLRQELATFKAKVAEYSQNKIDPNIQIIEIASGADVSYASFEPSPGYFGLWQGSGEVHEAILSSYARTDDFIFVVTGVKDSDQGVYYEAPLCDGSMPSTSNYGIPYTWIPMGKSAIGCANHLTWVHGFLHQLADVLNKVNPPTSPFISYGSNNYEYFGQRLSCSTNFGGQPYFPDADVAPLDPDFASCQGGFGDNWVVGYCASLVARGYDGEECNRRWDQHVLGTHFSTSYTIIGNSCRNGRRDFDETGVDTGGQCSVYGTPPPPVNQSPVVNAGSSQTVQLPAAATVSGTVTDDGLPSPPGAVTTTWSKASGPGIVTFANASARSTMATFSQVGTYVLRITANDGALSASSDVTITVNAQADTTPPVVSLTAPVAGATVSGATVTISATASDNVGVVGVQFRVDGMSISAEDTTSPYGIVWDSRTVSNGSRIITAVARDAAGNQTASVAVNVTVSNQATPGVNQPPMVNVGLGQSVEIAGVAPLDATITDDGLPSPPGRVTITWSKVSGPGTVTFADVAARSTTARFSQAGTYVLRITANDGALSASGDTTVVVTENAGSSPDTQAPTITNVSVSDVTATGATARWTTNEPSDSYVEYGVTTVYGSSRFDATLAVNHTVVLSGLESGNLYHFRIRSRDGASNLVVSEDRTFFATTADLVRLIRTEGDDKIYAVRRIGGVERRQWVPSPEAFVANGYRWDAVKIVRAAELQRYRRASLMRAAGDPKVYYVTESGMKRHIPTAAVFLSYGNRWEDIVEVNMVDLNAISDNVLIRASGDPRVYKLENGQKRWIATAEAFNRLRFNWLKIAPVNQTELDAHQAGADIQ